MPAPDPRRVFETKHNVWIRNKSSSWLHKFIAKFWKDWGGYFYTTWRWPWERRATIWLPFGVKFDQDDWTLEHELVHARDLRGFFRWCWFAFRLFFPPFWFVWGRWSIERHAYLHDLNRRVYGSVEETLDMLWRNSKPGWPRKWCEQWLKENCKWKPQH